MSDQKKQERVGVVANTLAEIEIGLEALEPLFDRLHKEIGDCYDAGVGTHAEAVRIRKGFGKAKGDLQGVTEKVLDLHSRCTRIAIREQCDVPPNLAIDGGLVQPMQGGR